MTLLRSDSGGKASALFLRLCRECVAGVERSEPPVVQALGARRSFLAARPQPPRTLRLFCNVALVFRLRHALFVALV